MTKQQALDRLKEIEIEWNNGNEYYGLEEEANEIQEFLNSQQ